MTPNLQCFSSWWFFTNPSEKYAQVKMGEILPQFSGWIFQKYLSCHHLVIIVHQPRFPWNKMISLTQPTISRSCEAAIVENQAAKYSFPNSGPKASSKKTTTGCTAPPWNEHIFAVGAPTKCVGFPNRKLLFQRSIFRGRTVSFREASHVFRPKDLNP